MVIGTHDEDGDGVPDSMDNCPAIANLDQAAVPSAEAVGTACDPRPGILDTGDHIAAFFSFAENARPNGIMGGEVFDMDRATLGSGELATQAQHTPTRVSIIASTPTFPTENEFIEIKMDAYWCRLEDCAAAGSEQCVRARGPLTTTEVMINASPAFRLELELLGNQLRCRYVTSTEETSVMVDALPATDRVRIRPNQVTLRIDSLTIYEVPPGAG
ncbi:MAG: thrombospondin type 3 repeat-containing protein [Kofleriaceae bacterium]